MTKVQTSVSIFPAVGRVGESVNNKPKFATSNVAEEVIRVGTFIKLGTDNVKQIKKLSATGDVALGKLWGVSMHDNSRETPVLNIDNTGGEGVRDFAVKETVAVMKEGSIYMSPEDAMTPASAIYIRHAGRQQAQTIVFDAALIASNVTNGSVGGEAIAPVTYASSNAATLTAIAAAIEAANANVSAVSNGTDTITVTTLADIDDQDLGGDWAVTLGSTQAGVTEAETATSVHSENIGRIRSDSDTSTATVAPAGTVRVLDSISAGGIGAVAINLN